MATNQRVPDTISEDNERFIYFIAAIAALAGVFFGFDTGVISGALLYIKEGFGLEGQEFVQELIVSMVLIGAIVGAGFGGYLADRLGRRRLIIIASVVFFAGSLMMAFAPSVWVLIAGRFVAGLSVGVASMVGPLYNSEVPPPRIRGRLVALNSIAVTGGILLSYLVNYAFGQLISGPSSWRWMLGFGIIPAVILGLGILVLPSSPRWLVRRGREEEARDVLSRLRGAEDTDPDEEIEEIKELESKEQGLSELLEPYVRPALLVGIGLAVLQQAAGINTVIYYAPTIFEETGFSNSASLLATVGVGLVNFGLTFVAVAYVDRVGRRPLLLASIAGQTVMLALLGLAFYLLSLSGSVGILAVACVILYIAFFAIGLGPVFWLMISEIYPLAVRGSAESVATVANWATNFLISVSFLSLVNAVGQGVTFWLYTVVGAAGVAFIYFLVPETKGRTLEEIEADLRGGALGGASADRSMADEGTEAD
jgi:sugar porter (SP) family MFS transporter